MDSAFERANLKSALEDVKAENRGKTQTQPSQTAYILCPVEQTLWDIKVVVGLALNKAGYIGGFNTDDGVNFAKKCGYTVLKFRTRKQRKLGIRGYDVNELFSDHVVIYSDGREVKNGFKPTEKEINGKDGKKTKIPVS